MNMKKRTILALSALFAASTLFTSCGGDAKVEETQAEPVEVTTPEETPAKETDEEITSDSVETETPVESVIPEEAPVAKKADEVKETPAKKAEPVAKKVEKKVEEVKEAIAGSPAMEFEQTEYQFGEITQGDKVEYTFKFKNTGTAPLLVTNARASCGCTVPEWPKEPIAPGASGQIDVVFNSRGKSGNQNKAVTITTNIADQPQQVVYLKGKVNVPEVEAPAAE